jgi:thiol-disulfide isomerase/thioredoxin
MISEVERLYKIAGKSSSISKSYSKMGTRNYRTVLRFHGSVDEFKDALCSWPGLTVMIFHRAWCGTCHHLLQLLPSVAADFPTMQFMAIDVDQAKPIAAQIDVNLVPMTKILEVEALEMATRGAVLGAKLPEIRRRYKVFPLPSKFCLCLFLFDLPNETTDVDSSMSGDGVAGLTG